VKKILLAVVFICTLLLSQKNVYAEEYYYVNDNGVSFTKAAYDFFGEFFYDGFQRYMTQDLFDQFVEEGFDFENTVIEKASSILKQPGNTRDIPFYDTQSRSIDMSKACGIVCRVSSTVIWHGTPIVQDYDVMGAYITGPTRITTPVTFINSSQGSDQPAAIVYDTDGYGAVLPVHNASDMIITQSFAYTGNGLIFMSHQHATSQISLTNAQLFTIGLSGYGNVFNFYGAATNVYDQMNGVYLTV